MKYLCEKNDYKICWINYYNFSKTCQGTYKYAKLKAFNEFETLEKVLPKVGKMNLQRKTTKGR
jgi:hypothetical protein